MKRITTGDFATVLKKYNPIINESMVRGWAKGGLLGYFRNPSSDRGRYYLDPDDIPRFLKTQEENTPTIIEAILLDLGLSQKMIS